MKGTGKPTEILTKLNELAGFSPDEEIELFEVSLLVSFCLIMMLCSVMNHLDLFLNYPSCHSGN